MIQKTPECKQVYLFDSYLILIFFKLNRKTVFHASQFQEDYFRINGKIRNKILNIFLIKIVVTKWVKKLLWAAEGWGFESSVQ